jgi:hypothetical protein
MSIRYTNEAAVAFNFRIRQRFIEELAAKKTAFFLQRKIQRFVSQSVGQEILYYDFFHFMSSGELAGCCHEL